MPSLAFVSPKGGVGKSTAALLLALGLAGLRKSVAIVDADPNKPLQHWSSLPGRPARISVHPAPLAEDVSDAVREARRRQPDWLIFDTEGSIRGVMGLRAMQADLVLIPLALSAIEVMQALKASELVARFGTRAGRPPRRLCLLTRLPAAADPLTLKAVIDELYGHGIGLLSTPLLDQPAYRELFGPGGMRQPPIADGTARRNAAAYVAAVCEAVSGAGFAAPPGPG